MDEVRERSEVDESGPTDEELVAATREGSLDAFSLLVRRYQDRLFSFLLQKTGNRQDAEDVAQATFLTAYRQLSRYQSRDRFAAWLFTIAHRRAISHYRSFFRRKRLYAEAEFELSSDLPDPAGVAEHNDDSRSLWRAARMVLTDPQQTALWLHYAEGMTMGEIGQALGKSAGNVKVMIHRARRILADHLAAPEQEQKQEQRPGKGAAGERAFSTRSLDTDEQTVTRSRSRIPL